MTEQPQKTQTTNEETADEQLIWGHFKPSDIFKFAGLLAFVVIIAIVMVVVWPYIKMVFEPGGIDALKEAVQGAGPFGFVMLLTFQFLQVVVAFIPGEVVQLVAGAMFGPWLGMLLVVVGCVLSSAFIYILVHKLGAPFVQAIVPTTFLDKFKAFERSGKLTVAVFILFLIPGLPKDVFTYLVPLTDMPMKTFLLVANVARIPGIFGSCFGANDIIEGNYLRAAIMLGIMAVLALLCIWQRDRFVGLIENITHESMK